MLNLYDALKQGYGDKKAKSKLENQGYAMDKGLSNNNQQVFYNNANKKLLVNVSGTHNLQDVGTDIYLAFGGIKNTNRYKEARTTLNKAKEKYKTNATVSGHSLGGTISGLIAGKDDQVFTLDKGATIGSRVRGNEKAFRTRGDLVSLLNSGATRVKTLANPNTQTGILPLDILNAHNVSNIKNQKIEII
jgi:hypothetical protein